VSGNATIDAFGYASILMIFGCAVVKTFGRNIVRHYKKEKSLKLTLSKNTTHIVLPDFVPTMTEYKNLYPIERKGKKLIMYKSVHRVDDKYISSQNSSFEYKIGETYQESIDKNGRSCGRGLHLSHKKWAIDFGRGWDNQALLECETDEKDVYVGEDCDGKVRTSKLKVIREVPKSEW
jgi:hypothetical protein